MVGLSHSLAGSVGMPSGWSAEEGAQHPGSRSTAGSPVDTDSADPAPTAPCTDVLQQPDNNHDSRPLANTDISLIETYTEDISTILR